MQLLAKIATKFNIATPNFKNFLGGMPPNLPRNFVCHVYTILNLKKVLKEPPYQKFLKTAHIKRHRHGFVVFFGCNSTCICMNAELLFSKYLWDGSVQMNEFVWIKTRTK